MISMLRTYFILLGAVWIAARRVVATCESTQVVIVGAGASGIGAARTFHANDVKDFVVVETNDYIGGRVKNVMFGGVSVELGAQWAHGTQKNHSVWQLVQKYNLSVHADNYDNIMYRDASTGAAVDPTASLLKLFDALPKATSVMAERGKNNESDVPLSQALQFGDWIAQSSLDHAVEFWTFPFATAALNYKTSGTYYAQLVENVDYIITDRQGYNSIFRKEAEPFASKIKLNATISAISKLPNGTYKTDTHQGHCYHSDHVLVTVSSGVLSSNAITFDPAIPKWKKESWAFFPMGHYCKNFLQFSTQFWGGEYYTMLVKNDANMYAVSQNTNLPTLYKDNNVLVVFTLDDKCFQDMHRTDEEVKDDIIAALRKTYGSIPDPIAFDSFPAFVRNAWGVNEHFQGSYSHVAPGVSDNDYKAITHPVGQIWFAGEYTAGEDNGYVHGAYDSGIRQAEQIMQCMQDETTCPGDFKKEPVCPEARSAAVDLNGPLMKMLVGILLAVSCWMQLR